MVQTAVIYCRVSKGDQSCDRQERDLLEYANKLGYQVIAIFKETMSGVKILLERKKVMSLAQARKIDVILVTELTRWGRSTPDLLATMQSLQSWKVSLIAQSGLQLDLATPHGKLIATFLASLAEYERDLMRERVISGLAAAKARGKKLGRQPGQRFKSDRLEPKVLSMVAEGASYRKIAKELELSKTTVMGIVKRNKLQS